jgi:hypothetical protein
MRINSIGIIGSAITGQPESFLYFIDKEILRFFYWNVQADQTTGGLYSKYYSFAVETFSIERRRRRRN